MNQMFQVAEKKEGRRTLFVAALVASAGKLDLVSGCDPGMTLEERREVSRKLREAADLVLIADLEREGDCRSVFEV